jgi:tRNA(adenine34) deaminase
MAAEVERGTNASGAPTASARATQANRRARRPPATARDCADGESGGAVRPAGATGPVEGRQGDIGLVMMMARVATGAHLQPERPAESTVSDRFFPRDEYFMRLALREAEHALEHDDVPIGAVAVRAGEVVGAAHNERELRQDPTAHAELLALREAARAVGSWRVLDTVLYVTLEPCAMCAGAIVLARVPRVVYGAGDPKAGAAGSVLDVLGEQRLNHRPEVAGGLLAEECGALLSEFFASRR